MPRNCDSCGIPLVPVYPEFNRRKTDQPVYLDALKIELSGGYGGYIDDYIEPFIICEDCADSILHDLPHVFISRLSTFLNMSRVNRILDYEKKDE